MSSTPTELPTMNPIPPRTPATPTKVYKGGCHCGKFEYECRHPVLEDGFEVISCNCSICTQRGYLNMYVPRHSNFIGCKSYSYMNRDTFPPLDTSMIPRTLRSSRAQKLSSQVTSSTKSTSRISFARCVVQDSSSRQKVLGKVSV